MPFQPEGLCGRGRWGLCLAEEETQSSVTVCPRYTTVTQQRHQQRLSPAEPSLGHPRSSRCSAEVPVVLLNPMEMWPWKAALTTVPWELPAPGVLGEGMPEPEVDEQN